MCDSHFLISWQGKMYFSDVVLCISLTLKNIFLKDQIVCVFPISWLVGPPVKPPATSVPAKSQTGRLAKTKKGSTNQALTKIVSDHLIFEANILFAGFLSGTYQNSIWYFMHPIPLLPPRLVICNIYLWYKCVVLT